MKTFLFVSMALLLVSIASAQSGQVASAVQDSKSGNPLNGATILLKNPDSSVAKMAVSNADGTWAMSGIAQGTYFLSISALGYADYHSKLIEIADGKTIKINPQMLVQNTTVLQGVVVSAKKPLIERKADKLVVNVESSLTAAGTSALEVLEKAPGVSVDKDGNISLQGKEGVMILIDDRPAYLKGAELANYLRSTPASSLEQLEVMTNPSSKYDASGNSGVINIRTKKIKKYGFNGSVNVAAMVTDEARANSSLNLNYRKGKVNLFGTYSYSLFNNLSRQYILRRFRDAGSKEVVSIFDQQGRSEYHADNNSIKLGMDIYASKKTIAGIVLSGFHNTNRRVLHNETRLKDGQDEVDSSLRSVNRIRGISDNFSGNLNLRHSFDSLGKKMTLDLDYVVYDLGSNMAFGTDYFMADGSVQKPAAFLRAATPSLVRIYSAKTDFTFPLKHGATIEAGLKSSYVNTDNDALYENKVGNGFEIDNNKTNHFLYNENINAAYISWNQSWKKWSAQAGLRAEHTNAHGHQLGNEVISDSSFTKSYLNLFPTMYISFKANEKNSFGLNYGRRIERPAYQDMNPFLYFLDEYTYEAGNVLLQPEFTNRIEFTHDYNDLIHTSVSYAHTKDAMTEVLKQNTAKRITYQTKENIADKQTFTISSGTNFQTGERFKTTLDLTLLNRQYKGALGGGELIVNSWMVMGKMSEQVKMGKGWNSELSGYYRTRNRDGQIVINPQWRVDFAIQKSVLKDKGSVNFFVRDLFNSQHFKGTVQYEDIDLEIHNSRVSRVFGISFKYRFGKPLKNLKQHNNNGASEEQNRVKSGS